MLSITGVMVLPAYLMSCLYLWKICSDHEFNGRLGISRFVAHTTAILGSVYAIWLIYAAGLSYLLMAVVFIALGLPVYWYARKQMLGTPQVFSCAERRLAWMIVLVAVIALYAFVHGLIKI